MPVLPPKIRLFSVQHNGVFVFVSNDMEGADHVVEGHPSRDEDRNAFTPRRQPDGSFTFFHPSTRTFMFVSNDKRGNDFVIEAHGPDELRNRFQIRL
jgi:hypothetical protein